MKPWRPYSFITLADAAIPPTAFVGSKLLLYVPNAAEVVSETTKAIFKAMKK